MARKALHLQDGRPVIRRTGIQHLLQEQAIFKKSAAGHEEQSIGLKIIRVGDVSQGSLPGSPTLGERSLDKTQQLRALQGVGDVSQGGLPGSPTEKLPRFKMADADTQRLMFRLLKAVVEAGDPHLWKILQEVLKLTPDEREAFSELLDRTSLSALIQMNTLVANRLDFLDDLRLLVADPFYKKKMLERKQLHKILNRESWIFGDQFTLLSSDQRMTAVLEQYCSFVDVPFDGAPVENDDVIDLFFGGKTPGVGCGAENNFLVVEIKRPKVKIGREELEQTRRYRTNICSDERFAAAAAKWTFIALSTEIADSVSLEVYGGRVPGLVDDKTYKGVRTEIWCKTWQQLIDEAELQLKLFKVQVGTSLAQNFDYLKKKHGDLLPGWAEDASGEVGAPMELLASASADVVAN